MVFIIGTSAGIKQQTQPAVTDTIKEATKRMDSKHKAEETISMPASARL
jgi:hypothetical protein